MDMIDSLPAVGTGIEHDPVAVSGQALGDRHLVRVRDQVGQQAAARRAQLGQIRVVGARDNEHVYGCLRIDITEGDRPVITGHYDRRYLVGGNGAEQAVRHAEILTCGGSRGPPTYMVALLRTHGAPPLWCSGIASFWLPPLRDETRAGAHQRHGMWVWGELQIWTRARLTTKPHPYP